MTYNAFKNKKEKENSQQIKKLIQIIDDKDQLMKDNETKFINKLKQSSLKHHTSGNTSEHK